MRLYRSFCYALSGIKSCIGTERNFTIQIIGALLVILSGIYFQLATMEWMFVIICIGSILTFELLNTALESLCDFVYAEKHPSIKKIKDIAAGAVLINAICSSLVGTVIFLPKILKILL